MVDARSLTPERRRYLEEKYSLNSEELDLLLEDLWAFTEESIEDFVHRRHGELQREGLHNPAIYARIAQEAKQGRFTCPELSLRQVRRIIYG